MYHLKLKIMKNLENYGVFELNTIDMKSMNGGYLLAYMAGYFFGALQNGVDGLGDEPVDSGTGLIIGQKY